MRLERNNLESMIYQYADRAIYAKVLGPTSPVDTPQQCLGLKMVVVQEHA